MLVCTVGYTVFGELFTNEAMVLTAFYSVFFIVILIQPLNSIAFTLDAIFKGLGEMAYLRNTLLGATFLGFVPMIYVGRWMQWELKGIWYAFVVWMIVRASALCIKYYNSYYKLAKNS